MPTFRIHLADGSKHDIDAKTPEDARKIVQARESGLIVKIKRVREVA